MAADNLLTEYHLTPDGSVKCTERQFRTIVGKEVERPQNAMEIMVFFNTGDSLNAT